MNHSNPLSRLSIIAVGMFVVFIILMSGRAPLQKQASASTQAPALNEVLRHNIEDWILQGRRVPDDWSHHRVVFSGPGNEEEAIANGTHGRWLSVANDPRYVLQEIKRDPAARRFITEEMGLGTEERSATGESVAAQYAAQAQEALKAETAPGIGAAKAPTRKKNGGIWGQSLTSSSVVGTVGAGNYPAKYSFTGTVSCTDFVVFNTSLAGSATQATIVAYSNIYFGTCTGTVPTVSWQYNTAFPQGSTTGDGSKVATSVTLSLDGTQIAFVQSNSSNVASLVLLKMAPGNPSLVNLNSGTNNVLPGSYRSCAAPCMTRFTLSGSTNDTNSSPFVDYIHDTLYVGDNSGKLHQFTGVFGGTPAESGSPWPVTVSAKTLTSPVYDSGTTNVFVADAGGFLYSYTSSSGTRVGVSSQLANSSSKGIVASPLLDSSTGTVYVFLGQDNNTTSNSHNCQSSAGCNGVFRFSTTTFTTSGTGTCVSTTGTSWTSGTNCGVESVFGVGNASTVLYGGAFDNAFYTSSGTSGNLWTCAATGTPAPKLVNSSMTSFSSIQSVATNAVNPLASAAATCSPVTEILNGSTDRIFLSVTTSGNQTSQCTGACLYSFNVTSGSTTSASNGLLVPGGSSGIIIDNTATGGGSQLYFTYLSTATSTTKCPAPSNATSGGCAVQASQAALN